MKAICEALGVSRSNIAASFQAAPGKPLKRVGRPTKPEDNLVGTSRPSSAASRPMAIVGSGRS